MIDFDILLGSERNSTFPNYDADSPFLPGEEPAEYTEAINDIMEGINHPVIPEGSNRLARNNLAQQFTEKLLYKPALLQTQKNTFNLLDTWNQKNFFGKTNELGLPIYPRESFLKLHTHTRSKETWALNFVVDLFNDFYAAQDTLYKTDKAKFAGGKSLMFPPRASGGWKSVHNAYHTYMNDIYSIFNREYVQPRKSRIMGFDSFAQLFFDFINEFYGKQPFTFSAFVMSSRWSRLSSGLVVDIYKGSYDKDEFKFEEFFLNGNFELYRQLAGQSGFAVDENIPWRLYVNLQHPKTKEKFLQHYVSLKPYSPSVVYGTAFRLAHLQDVNLLRFHLVSFYNNFVSTQPSIDIPHIEGGALEAVSKKCTQHNEAIKLKTIFLDPENAFIDGKLDVESNYFKKFGDRFWLKFYFDIKILEFGVHLKPERKKVLLRKAFDYYYVHGFYPAVTKIYLDMQHESEKQIFRKAGIKGLTGQQAATAITATSISTTALTTAAQAPAFSGLGGGYSGGGSGGY